MVAGPFGMLVGRPPTHATWTVNFVIHSCSSAWKNCLPNSLSFGIEKLAELGVQGLNFCGGEPLLRRDLPELVRHAKGCGLETMVSTNGNHLQIRLPELAGYIDWVALPLDGPTPEIHEHFRGRGNFARICALLETLAEYPHIKINTVVTARNVASVPQIGDLNSRKSSEMESHPVFPPWAGRDTARSAGSIGRVLFGG